jgi:hypothetical protein
MPLKWADFPAVMLFGPSGCVKDAATPFTIDIGGTGTALDSSIGVAICAVTACSSTTSACSMPRTT